MDMNAPITTRITAQPQTGVAVQATALSGGNSVFSGIGGSFMDMIFANISEGEDLKNDTAGASLIATPLAMPVVPESSLELSIDSSVDDILTQLQPLSRNGADISNDISVDSTTSDGLKQLHSYLDTLLNGLPAEQRPQIVQVTPGEFKKALAALKADAETFQNTGEPSLIATGLTPQELTSLIAQINTAEQNGTLALPGMVKIVPPETVIADKPFLLLPRALVAIQEQAQSGDDVVISNSDSDTDALATALNKLIVGGVTPEISANKKNTVDTLSLIPGGVSTDEGSEMSLREFELSGKIEAKIGTDGKNIPSNIEKAAEKIKSLIGAGLSTITNNVPGSVEASAQWRDVFPEGMDSLNIGLNGKPLALSNTSTMTSLVTSAPQATYPHPATQAVAAIITKAASTGEDKAFTIKLDPPELGRVEVKMSIDKHNALKAHLIIEKPETFMMLQRDAQILERSLQGMGMDTGSGLSFELAQDNMFQNDGDRGGENYQSGKSADGKDSLETVIESTMTWSVDPQTGMQHYNILV